MDIGVPLEVKGGEVRVGLTPAAVRTLVHQGHTVAVEEGAGLRVGFPDRAYVESGARLTFDAAEIYRSELIVKVKEIQASEYSLLQPGSIVFAYQQLAPTPLLLAAVLDRRVACIAYETVEDEAGRLPLLAPMSRIAGCLAPQIAAWALWQSVSDRASPRLKGPGILLPSVSGLPAAKVVIVGAGHVGYEAARLLSAMGCEVVVLSRSERGFEQLRALPSVPVATRILSESDLDWELRDAAVVIGAVLEPGRLSPKLITRAMLGSLREGAVLVDVGIDQGGIAVTSRPSTLADPLYVEEGILHYCVPNIPALVGRSATLALVNATLPYVERVARLGLLDAARADPGLARGVCIFEGQITDPRLAVDTGRPSRPGPWA
jgi:alanine dehydrogenase